MEKRSTNLILLTGAGFTKNFDGFLGREMWTKVFNNPLIQNNDKLRSLLQNNYDFESVYSEIEDNNEITSKDKKTFQEAIERSYKALDDAVRAWEFNSNNPTALDVYKLFGHNGLLEGLFKLSGQKQSFIFTLNQDLLLERRLNYRAVGVNPFNSSFYQHDGKGEFKKEYFITLPKDNVDYEINRSLKNHNGIHYIKLHGSFGWKTFDGSNQMALGKNKWKNLQKEPLLCSYFKLFNEIIKEGNKKMLIIGYGFGDEHINKLLLEGVEDYNLKLYIITTMPIQKFDDNLNNGHYYAKRLKNGIRGYFPYRLSEILPPNQAGSVHLEEIKQSLQ